MKQKTLNTTVSKSVSESKHKIKWTAWGETIHVTDYNGFSCHVNAYGDSDRGIPPQESRDIAQRIVTAVNCHDDMLEALREAVIEWEEYKPTLIKVTVEMGGKAELIKDPEWYIKAKAAIAKATNNQ